MKTLDERKAGTTCTRCGEPRYPLMDWAEPYTCARCREVLAGGDALDPKPGIATAAQLESLAKAREVRRHVGV